LISNVQQGAVYLFNKAAGGWIDATERTKLSAFDGVGFLGFGASLAMAGETIVAGTLPSSSAVQGAVYVLTPVTAVIEDLMSLISGLALQAGTRESLNSKLEAAKKAAASGDAETACALLSAFINFVVSSPWRAGDAAHSGGSGGSGCDRNNVIDFNRGRALPPRTMVDRSVASVSLNYVRSIQYDSEAVYHSPLRAPATMRDEGLADAKGR
jgi:hypothetical protein